MELDWNFFHFIVYPFIAAMVWWVRQVQAEGREERATLQAKIQSLEVTIARDYVHGDRLKDFEKTILETILRLENKIDRLQEKGFRHVG